MNPGISNSIIGKFEKDAVEVLNQYNCIWRVIMRDGQAPPDLSEDRNDKRYNLVIKDQLVERVLPG